LDVPSENRDVSARPGALEQFWRVNNEAGRGGMGRNSWWGFHSESNSELRISNFKKTKKTHSEFNSEEKKKTQLQLV
jgi:hypothetical protein